MKGLDRILSCKRWEEKFASNVMRTGDDDSSCSESNFRFFCAGSNINNFFQRKRNEF